jgi:hypothetical protein
MNADAGWYSDPSQRHELRYWDGNAWSDHVADRGVTSQDPPYTSAVAAASVASVATFTAVNDNYSYSQPDHYGYSYPERYGSQLGGTTPASATGAEAGRFIAYLVGFFLLFGVIGFVVASISTSGKVAHTQAELDHINQTAMLQARLVAVVVGLIIGAVMAPSVGYRRHDTFMLLIPFWSLVIIVKWLWRLACIDRRYWAPAPR